MNIAISIIICIYVFLGILPFQKQGWRGIVPLHSTREEVERLIGPPMTENGLTYDLKNERVNVIYSDGACAKGQPSEWNVPAGTVVGIIIYPQTKLLLYDLNISLNGFKKHVNPHNQDSIYYNNEEDGISIGTTPNGEVTVIQYLPAAKDSYLRCPNSPVKQPSLEAHKFDEYVNLPFRDERARLDNLANYLKERPELIGYIIAYAGRQAREGEAKARAERAKNYLVNERGIDSIRVISIDGGYREKLMFELYALPRDVSPPASTPTVNPKDVLIIKSTGGRTGGKLR